MSVLIGLVIGFAFLWWRRRRRQEMLADVTVYRGKRFKARAEYWDF